MLNRPSSYDITGAEVQYFRLEPRYWAPILDRFADASLRCVTTYVHWNEHMVGEPNARYPAGVLDFEGRTDPRLNLLGFLDLVVERGLTLNFRCGPFCCNEAVHGGYPPWLVMGDPNLMVWDYQNRPTRGYWIAKREGMQPSYLHPEYLAWCEKWLAEMDRIIEPRLAKHGGPITMLNLDNEVSYIVQDSFLACDYNPINVAPGGFYHRFLEEKYAGDTLPYPDRFRSIEEVTPPRDIPEAMPPDELAWRMDWVEFKQWTMARYIAEVRAIHERHGVSDVTFMTNLNPHRPEGVPTRFPAFEKATRGLVGYDFYRYPFLSWSGYSSMARVLKLMNASLGYTWSAEFMAGWWNKDMAGMSRVSDDHMRFMARCALAHGCKAIGWFMFHDRRVFGDCPVSSHGHPRPSLDVLRETAGLIKSFGDGWETLMPATDVGVVYDLASHTHTATGDPMPSGDDLHVGKPTLDGVPAGLASRDYEALHRLIEHAGFQAAAVDADARPDLPDHLCLLFLPGSPVITDATAALLKTFVDAGGTLIVTGAWPRRSTRGATLGFPAPPANGETTHGRGRLIHWPDPVGDAQPEHDDLNTINRVRRAIHDYAGGFHVRIRPESPVVWEDWGEQPGVIRHEQPRNLGVAVLHRHADGDDLLFVLNLYIEAVRFALEFGDHVGPIDTLEDLDDGSTHPVIDRGVTLDLDLDRKACRIYRVLRPKP